MSVFKRKSPTDGSLMNSPGTEQLLLEVLRTNQVQMELLASMTATLGKVADLLVPSAPPEAQTGRFGEGWTIEDEKDEA